jgi:serine/threonine protein kinase
LGAELEELLAPKNGRLLPDPKQPNHDPHNITFSPEIVEFHHANQSKVNVLSDIYSIGAILYRLLLGSPPPIDIPEHISKKRLHEKSPEYNVYNVPYFFKDFILSNDMCYILVKLLNSIPK